MPQQVAAAALSPLESIVAQVNDLLNASNLLMWDASVMMPASTGAQTAHSSQTATLKGIAQQLLLALVARRPRRGRRGQPPRRPVRGGPDVVRGAAAGAVRVVVLPRAPEEPEAPGVDEAGRGLPRWPLGAGGEQLPGRT